MTKKMELTPLEKWERLTFADNFIFCKVLEDNPDVCKELLELLLDIKIERIEQPVSERYFKTDFDSRGIRFDVYVKDENGRSFDIEIQTSHNTNLAKRARYYQGLIDVDNLQSGEDYNKFFQIVKGILKVSLMSCDASRNQNYKVMFQLASLVFVPKTRIYHYSCFGK